MKSLVAPFSVVFSLLFFLNGIEVEGEMVGACDLPEPPLFGSIRIDYKKNKISYVCDEGFNLAGGSRARKCKKMTYDGSSYYDWTGREPTCYSKALNIRECPFLEDPENGQVIVSSYEPDGKAEFFCDAGHVLVGSQTILCRDDLEWSRGNPTCQARSSVKDFANALKDKFVDKFASSNGQSEGKLKAGKSGLDLVFAIDISESIGPESLENAKAFVKVIVKKFGITNDSKALNGTRIAVMTFSDTTDIVFNFDDAKVRSIAKVNKKINKIKTKGGGTDFIGLLSSINRNHRKYFGKHLFKATPGIKDREANANRAIFIITDAEETVNNDGSKRTESRIRTNAKTLREDQGYEIFAIGVGTKIQKSLLAEIASPPYLEHVFLIRDKKDLKKIGETIAEENIDYGKCGISGNTVAGDRGVSKEAAWPWIGWYSVVKSSGSMITCGGVLLCDEWFLTLASCVTETNGEDIVTLEDGINLYLADHSVSDRDDHELMVQISEVQFHPNYTGEANEYGVRSFDIALLRLGHDNTTRPKLNKYVKPICFLEIRDQPSYTQGKQLLEFLKTERQKPQSVVAGWGHMGQQKVSGVFPWTEMKQYDSAVVSDDTCRKKYRSLDSDMFFCVGDIIRAPSEHCPGDIGGPLMKELEIRRIAVLGLAVKTAGCVSGMAYDFNIFLDVFHPDISKWVQSVLRGCNRLNEVIPYVEEEINEDAVDKDGDDADDANEADAGENDNEVNDDNDDNQIDFDEDDDEDGEDYIFDDGFEDEESKVVDPDEDVENEDEGIDDLD